MITHTVALSAIAAGILAFAGPGGFDLSWHTIDGGGGSSSGGSFSLLSTLGQPDAGVLTGGPFELAGGFLAAAGPPPPPPCPGDTTGDQVVDVNDLNNVILDWGTDGSANNGDLTGPLPGSPPDGVVDVNDLNAVIVGWGACVAAE